MEHQYPVAITGNENMLAELMLPDQAHARNQDWTIFFLHKDSSEEEEDRERAHKEERRRRRRRRRNRAAGIIDEEDEEDLDEDDEDPEESDGYDTTDSEPEGGEGPPLIYVLNLVNTKHDKTVKRGAIVKAMAICTRHPFLHIYKVSPPGIIIRDDADKIALAATSLGGVFQIAGTRNVGFTLRSGQQHGLITYASAEPPRATSLTGQR